MMIYPNADRAVTEIKAEQTEEKKLETAYAALSKLYQKYSTSPDQVAKAQMLSDYKHDESEFVQNEKLNVAKFRKSKLLRMEESVVCFSCLNRIADVRALDQQRDVLPRPVARDSKQTNDEAEERGRQEGCHGTKSKGRATMRRKGRSSPAS